MARLFGTDGVRGIANTELTCDLAFRLGQASAYVLASDVHRPTILVGRDTRISGEMLESALVAGICSVGARAVLVEVLPTPAIAYLTRFYEADAGVVISASHNTVEYNGIKFFDKNGYKLPDAVEDKIEEIVRGAAAIYGCTAECDYYFGPSPLINDDEELVAVAQGAARKQIGPDCLRPMEKMTGAEDFSVYLEHIPGVYGYLGIRDRAKGIDCSNHHPAFLVDEEALHYGTGIYAQFAVDYLNGQK